MPRDVHKYSFVSHVQDTALFRIQLFESSCLHLEVIILHENATCPVGRIIVLMPKDDVSKVSYTVIQNECETICPFRCKNGLFLKGVKESKNAVTPLNCLDFNQH